MQSLTFRLVTARLTALSPRSPVLASTVAKKVTPRSTVLIPLSSVSSPVPVVFATRLDIVLPTVLLPHPSSARTARRKVWQPLLSCPILSVVNILSGHSANDCKNPRKIDRSGIADIPAEYAWNELVAASAEGDLDDMKEAIAKYIKATPDVTYVDLEKAFRIQGLQIYIIALEKELQPTYTNMDLQGNLDKKYSVSFRKSPKHARPKEKDLWPASPEENLERLLDAGEPVDRGIPKCSNCEQLGHMSKSCPEEKQENADRPMVKCFNCDEVGHRVRDCKSSLPS